jgi:hypothetical protein
MRRVLPWAGLILCCAVVGCGPTSRPLPERLNDDDQKRIDQAWDAALAPPDRHDRQTWLDVMVGAHAYQAGVDQFEFRSVKRWAGGTVVMESRFDRAKPADDRFTITVNDRAGKPLRTEAYTREDVGRTVRELTASQVPDDAVAKAAFDTRVKRIADILPQPKGDPAK